MARLLANLQLNRQEYLLRNQAARQQYSLVANPRVTQQDNPRDSRAVSQVANQVANLVLNQVLSPLAFLQDSLLRSRQTQLDIQLHNRQHSQQADPVRIVYLESTLNIVIMD